MSYALLYAGSILLIIWGLAHIGPTKAVVRGFEPTSTENRRIITMEWVAEGLTLCFLGLLTLFVTILEGPSNPVSLIVYRACGGMLLVMAAWTSLTGARTSLFPIRICPIVKSIVAILFLVGSVV